MSRITYEERDLRRALAEEGLHTDAIARVLHAQASVAPPVPAGAAAPAPLLGIGASGFAVLLGVILAVASLVASSLAVRAEGRPGLIGIAVAYLAAFAIVAAILRHRLAPGAQAMLGLGAAATAAVLAQAALGDTRFFGEELAAGDGLLDPRGARVAMAAAAFLVGALVAARLRAPAAWNVAGILLALLLASPSLTDDPRPSIVIAIGLVMLVVGEVASTRLGSRCGTGATTAGAALLAVGIMATADASWGPAAAGAAVVIAGAVTARPGILGAGAALLFLGLAAVVIDRAGSAAVTAVGLLVAAAAVLLIGVALASAQRRSALEHRLAPPWRRAARAP